MTEAKHHQDQDLLQSFVLYITVELNLRPNSIIAYRRDIARYLVFLESQGIPVLEASPNDIVEWLACERHAGKASSTIGRALVSVKMLYQFAHLENLISRDPACVLDSPKAERKLPQILNPEELARLLAAPDTHGGRLAKRDKALIEVLYSTAARASEVSGLILSCINLHEGFCFCRGKTGERILFLGDPAVSAIREYLKETRPRLVRTHTQDFLFLSRTGRQLGRESIWHLVKFYGNKVAQIQKPVYTHLLRHTAASNLCANGANLREIQEILGHSSIASTQVYVHIAQDGLTAMHHQYHPRG